MMFGEFAPEYFHTSFSLALGFLYMFIVVIIMLNVLIAIVSDSYDAAMAKSDELYWRAKYELITEVSTTFQSVFKWAKPKIRTMQAGAGCVLGGVDKFHDNLVFLLNYLFGGGEIRISTFGKIVRLLLSLPLLAILMLIILIIFFVILPIKFCLKQVRRELNSRTPLTLK